MKNTQFFILGHDGIKVGDDRHQLGQNELPVGWPSLEHGLPSDHPPVGSKGLPTIGGGPHFGVYFRSQDLEWDAGGKEGKVFCGDKNEKVQPVVLQETHRLWTGWSLRI